MSTSTTREALAIRRIDFMAGNLIVALSDGRVLSLPIKWFPRLAGATEAQRANWRLLGAGEGVHWPDIDEDLSLDGFLAGRPAPGSDEYAHHRATARFVELDSDLAASFASDGQVNAALREYLRLKRESA